MTYAVAKAAQATIEAEVKANADRWNATRDRLAAELGIPARGDMGLVPDAIKFHPDYQADRNYYNGSFAKLRNYNSFYLKAYRAEIKADRLNKRCK